MKRLFTVLIIVIAAVFIFSGCEKKSDGLVYWSMWNEVEPQGQVIARAAKAFTEETGIPVELNFYGRDVRIILETSLNAGRTIDIFDYGLEWLHEYLLDHMLPLDEYAQNIYPATGELPFNQVINQTLFNLARTLGGGQIFAIPYQPFVCAVMYNKDLFDQAGITSSPVNWDQMLDACAKLKAIGVAGFTVDDAYMSTLFGYTMSRIVGMDIAGSMSINNDFTGPQVLRFGQIWENMIRNGYITPASAGNVFPQGQVNDFAAGKAAMYLNGTWLPNEIRNSVPNMRWGAFAFPAIDPAGDGIETNNFGSQGFAVNKNSKLPDEAFQFILMLTTGKWDTELAQVSGGIPIAIDAVWPESLAEARVILENTTRYMPWAARMEDDEEVNTIIKDRFARLIRGDFDAQGFAGAMRR